MNQEFYKEQAQRVRALAEKADLFTRKRLLDLADRYDAKCGSPSRASRMIERPLPLPRTAPRVSAVSGGLVSGLNISGSTSAQRMRTGSLRVLYASSTLQLGL